MINLRLAASLSIAIHSGKNGNKPVNLRLARLMTVFANLKSFGTFHRLAGLTIPFSQSFDERPDFPGHLSRSGLPIHVERQ